MNDMRSDICLSIPKSLMPFLKKQNLKHDDIIVWSSTFSLLLSYISSRIYEMDSSRSYLISLRDAISLA